MGHSSLRVWQHIGDREVSIIRLNGSKLVVQHLVGVERRAVRTLNLKP